MRRRIVLAAVLLIACVPAWAGPLRQGWVDAEAKWVIHLDCEGFRASTLGKFILEEGNQIGIPLDDLDELKEEFGLDLRRDVASLTFYGTSADPGNHSVVMAVGSDALEQALDKLAQREEVQVRTIQVEGYDLREIGDDSEKHFLLLRRLEGSQQRLVVLADGSDLVVKAIRVIDGKAASLASGQPSKLLRGPREGAFAFVAATKLEGLPDVEPASEFFRLSDGFAADVGEKDGQLSAEVSVIAATANDATNMAQVVEGLTAMSQMLAERSPEMKPVADLAGAVAVKAEDRRLSLSMRYDAKELVRILKERFAAREHQADDGDDGDDEDGEDAGDGADPDPDPDDHEND